MKKTFKILLFILLVGSLSLGFLFLRTKPPAEQRPEPAPVAPKIPRYIQGEVPVLFNVPRENFVFPEKLRLLSVGLASFSKDEAKAVASRLNFSGEPAEFEDTKEGTKYYWASPDSFLVITPKTGVVKYGPSKEVLPATANARLSEEQLIAIAKEFLAGAEILSAERLRGASVSYLKKNETVEGLSETSKEAAQIFQVNLSYSVSEFEMLTINPSSPLVYVKILPGGTVFEAEAHVFRDLSLGLTEYKTKTYDEVSASSAEFRLVALLNGFVNLADLSARNIKQAVVEKIRLAYLYDTAGSSYLQPVFVLEGPVLVSGSEANRAIFYLPALSAQP